MLSENIVQIAEKIKQLQQRVDERRNVWSQTTKPQIKKSLEKFCKEIDLDLHVAENELRENFSSVQLSFGLAPSGIIERTQGGGGRSFMKNPGYLNFAQSISGKIGVAVIYPFVEDLQNKPATLLLAQHEPEDNCRGLIELFHIHKLSPVNIGSKALKTFKVKESLLFAKFLLKVL